MDIPKIGSAKGIFEIFIPGSFLLINMVGIPVLVFFPEILHSLRVNKIELGILLNPVISTITLICFGYLTGMILRLLKPGRADKRSAKMLRKSNKNHPPPYYESRFPYIEIFLYQMENDYYSRPMQDFFNSMWENRLNKKEYPNHYLFNLYKYMTCFNDKEAASEILAAESLTRYLTGIFYAICFSQFWLILFLITLLGKSTYQFMNESITNYNYAVFIILLLVLILYWYSNRVLLQNFRFIRLKEVLTVLIGSFKNRKIFENSKT